MLVFNIFLEYKICLDIGTNGPNDTNIIYYILYIFIINKYYH